MKTSQALLTIASIALALWATAATSTNTGPKSKGEGGQASAFATTASTSEHRIRAVQLVQPYSGWILTDSALLWTSSDGDRWEDITPLKLDATAILSVHFADATHGWVVISTPSLTGPPEFVVAATRNRGMTWTTSNLPLDEDVDIARASIHFVNDTHGWVMLRLALTMNTSMGRLFRTADGGDSWLELPKPPSGEAVQFTSNLDGTVVGQPHSGNTFATSDAGVTWHHAPVAAAAQAEQVTGAPSGEHVDIRSFVDERYGWLLTSYGDCPAGKRSCHQDNRLYTTRDAGLTIRDVTPFERHPARAAGFVPRTEGFSNGNVGTSAHPGFDLCQAPRISYMQAWWDNSPYFDVNMYYGGNSRGCPTQTYLKDSGWTTLVTEQGWGVIPTWVGPQAACADRSFAHVIGVTGDALSEGETEATAAADAAGNFGIAGTITYYDLESYSTTDTACRQNVQSFIRGWVRGLHARGLQAGVYIQSKNAHNDIESVWGTADAPNAVWIVSILSPKPAPYTTVPTTGLGLFSDNVWTGATRIRQYYIDTTSAPNWETWGPVSLEIDNDQENGPVVSTVGRKFAVGDFVTAPSGVSIRSSPAGGLIGSTTTSSNPGTVIGGPTAAELSGIPYNWWQIRWQGSSSGWSAEELLSAPLPGTINVKATNNDATWEGYLGFNLDGPSGISGAVVPFIFSGNAGTYTVQYVNGGPAGGTFTGITPAPSQAVSSGGTVTFTLNFTSAGSCSAGTLGSASTTSTCTPPNAPSGLSATTISGTQINLGWADNSTNETGFKIERKTGAGGTYSQIVTPGVNATFYQDTTVSCATQYYYRVRATNSGVDSGYSNEANATATACSIPTVTTTAATGVTANSATFNATINGDGGSAILERRFDWGIYPAWTDATYLNGGVIVVSGSSFSYAASGLAADTPYQFRAWARNSIGWATVGNGLTFRTAAAPPPVCTSFTINPSSASPSSSANSQSVTITGSPAGCQGGSWGASGNGSWLTVSPTGGSGSGSTTVFWSQNLLTSSRSDNATIAGNTFSVTQSGTTPPTCTSFTINPSSASPSSSANSQLVTITGSPTGCQGGSWGASGNGSWLTVSPTSGSGSGSTTVFWNQNWLTSSRSDNATIAGATFSVTQSVASGSGSVASHPFIDVPGATVQVHDLGVGLDGSVYVLFPTASPKALAVVKSTDGGVSWSSPVSVPNSTYSNSEYHLAVDSSGTVHVVWWLSSVSGTETYYSRSINGGASFSSPILVRTGNTYNGYRTNNAIEPVVAADGSDNVYVAYAAYTKDWAGNFVGYNVWVSKSTDGGSSFQPEFSINTISSEQKKPKRILATASNFYVLYIDETNNDLYFYRRNAGPASANTGRLNANMGSVQYDGDLVSAPNEMTFYAAYSDTTGDSEGNITFCRSTDGGITWPTCTRVNSSANRQQDSPRVGLDSLGGLHVAWADGRSSGRYQTYYSYSADGGASFSSNVNLSAPVTQTDFTQPHLVVDNSNSAVYVSATRNYSQVVVARMPTTPLPQEPPPTPTGVVAAAVSTTRVNVAWTAVSEASGYQIDRKAAGGGFSQIGTSPTNTYSDNSASADSAYLYRVRSVSGSVTSTSSAADLATTVLFVDSPLTPGIFVKAVHLSQLRTAVNAVRLLAGLPEANFTDAATTGTSIKAIQVTELRSALDAALGPLSISTSGYTDASPSGVAIKAVHFQELRDRVH